MLPGRTDWCRGMKDRAGEPHKSIPQTINRRNSVVHATVSLGVAYGVFNESCSAMIGLLLTNDPTRRSRRAFD